MEATRAALVTLEMEEENTGSPQSPEFLYGPTLEGHQTECLCKEQSPTF